MVKEGRLYKRLRPVRVNGWQSPKPISRSDLRAMTRQIGCIISPSRVLADFQILFLRSSHPTANTHMFNPESAGPNDNSIPKYHFPMQSLF